MTMAKKKAVVPQEGIFIGKNSKGFFYRIKENKFILATAGGYNTKQGTLKGLLALNRSLNHHFDKVENKYVGIIDLTKKK